MNVSRRNFLASVAAAAIVPVFAADVCTSYEVSTFDKINAQSLIKHYHNAIKNAIYEVFNEYSYECADWSTCVSMQNRLFKKLVDAKIADKFYACYTYSSLSQVKHELSLSVALMPNKILEATIITGTIYV